MCGRDSCRLMHVHHLRYCCVMLQAPIVSKGGVEVIVATVQRHIDNVDVAHYGCWALACLADNDTNKVVIDLCMNGLCV